VTFARLRKMALALPGVEEGTSFGTPSFHVKGKFMARLRDDDPDVLVLKPVEEDEKEFLMGTQPGTFFVTDHYRGYPAILIRLSKVDAGELQALVEQSWRCLAPKGLLAAIPLAGRAARATPAPRRRRRSARSPSAAGRRSTRSR